MVIRLVNRVIPFVTMVEKSKNMVFMLVLKLI
jgi:hypothetical protein